MAQPIFQSFSAYDSESFVTIRYNVALDAINIPSTGQFEVSVNGAPLSVTTLVVDSAGMTVTLNMSTPFSAGDRIDYITFTDPTAGNDVLTLQGTDGIDAATVTMDNQNPLYTSDQHWVVGARPAGPSAPSVPVLDAASDTGSNNSDRITSATQPTITGTGGVVGATVHLFDGATDIGSAVVAAGGAWSITPGTALTSGSHAITAKQVDGTGTSVASATLTLVIDTSVAAPSTPVIDAASDTGVSNSDGITSNASPRVTGTAEAGSTVTLYDTNGTTALGSGVATGGNYDITVNQTLSTGLHVITAKAVDVAGNISTLSSGLNVRIDTTAPATIALSATATPDINAIAGTTLATLSSVDANAVNYSLVAGNAVNDAQNNLFTLIGGQLKPVGNLTAGTYNLYVSATDVAGNHSEQALTFTVTHGPGVASIVRAAAASPTVPGTSTSVAYSVSFSEAVSGVDTTDFTVSGTSTGRVASVVDSGDGILYTVTVDNIIGNGTLRLDLKASGTGIQSAGLDPIIGGYTSGQSYTIDRTNPAQPSAPVLTALTDSGLNNSDGITRNTAPDFTGTGEIGSTVSLFDASNGNALIGSGTVDSTGHYTITSGAPLTAGTHLLYAQASDAAANTSAVTSNQVVIIDNVAPSAIVLSTPTVYTNAGLNARVGTLSATDAISGGAFSYQLVAGIGSSNNADFTLNAAGELTLNNPSAVGVSTESIRVQVTDAAGNSFIQILTVNVTTAPAPPATPAPSVPTVDGVPVTSTTTTLPSGTAGTTLTIPVVSASAGGIIGAPNVADIPLVTSNSTVLLAAQVPIGMGLTSTGGASKTAGNSLTELIAAIRGQTATHTSTDQTHLTGNGTQFISLLPSEVPLLINTVVVKNIDATSATPLTLTGTSTTNQHTALVIDTSQLPSISTIVLSNVDFAAVVGAVTMTGSTAGQVITGDLANQTLIVSSSTPSQIYAGGGNDVLQYGVAPITATATTVDAKTTAALVTNSSTVASLSAATSVLLNGGTGSDTAVFGKAQSAYTIDKRDGYVLVTDKADNTQRVTVTNNESLKFSDGVVGVESRVELTTLAGLYQTAFGRQADIGGFDYWGAAQASGVSLGTIAVNMLGSSEAVARGFALNGDTSHDIAVLYRAVFGRDPEANGLAYWQNKMSQGQSIVDVANGFMSASEMDAHKLAVTAWDMNF